MARSPKIYYGFILLLLITALTGCELQRPNSEISDLGPVEDLPTSTLAPLGSDSGDLAAEATPIPTIINVQPTATVSSLGEGEAAEQPELVASTAQPVELSAGPAADANAADEASVSPQGAAVTAESSAASAAELNTEEPIIVDAPSEELPDGGPIAANPPASQTTGDYGIPLYEDTSHTVQPGDTLFSLSQYYGTTVEAIMYANGLRSDMIYLGQVLIIPADGANYSPPAYEPALPGNNGGYHMVAARETLFSIAQQYGTSVEAIATANGISYPYIIYEGQYLTIPANGANPGFPPPMEGYYPPPAEGYYPQPGDGYYASPTEGYQQAPMDGYQQPPAQGYYPPTEGYYTPPGGGYYPQPEDGYQQPPTQGYYPPQDGGYPAPNGASTHTVAPGETLYSIATRYGTNAQTIAAANGIPNPNQIYVGQVLYLP